jgi:hypothetical protein
LTYDDFRGGIVVISAGGNLVYFVGGGSATAIIFGIVAPAYVLATLDRFFRHGDRAALETLFYQALALALHSSLASALAFPEPVSRAVWLHAWPPGSMARQQVVH